MKIDRVHIEHYKSLSNVTVEMHPNVTVLVGPNGSGKSNFVDALELMRDLGQSDSIRAADKRGGLPRMIENDQGRFHNASCQISDGDLCIDFSIRVDGSTSFMNCGPMDIIREGTSQWRFPKFSPHLLRPIDSITRTESLEENLKNWAAIYYKNSSTFIRVIEALRIVLPDLQDVQITHVGNTYFIPEFHFANKEGIKKSFDAAQLSDGALHIFGLLLTLYQSPSPEVIVIEEPEQYLHPSVLSLLANCIKEVSDRSQIIVTTHSPLFVEQFLLAQIRVVAINDGRTVIDALHPHQMEAVDEGLFTLAELMTSEGLRIAQESV